MATDVTKIAICCDEHALSSPPPSSTMPPQSSAAAAAAIASSTPPSPPSSSSSSSSSSSFAITNTSAPAASRIQQALAGAGATGIARFIVAPLDVLKIRFQLQAQARHTKHQAQYRSVVDALRTILREEGIRGLWKGTAAAELLVVPYGAVSFAVYQWCRSRMFSRWDHLNPHLVNGASGSIAGLLATSSTYPLDLLRTRMAAQQTNVYQSLRDGVKQVINNHGFRGLYSGMYVTTCGIVPFFAVQFTSYEALKKAAARAQNVTDSSRTATIMEKMTPGACGFLAGMFAKTLTMPWDVLKKRYQCLNFNYKSTCPFSSSSASSSSSSSVLTPESHHPHPRYPFQHGISLTRAAYEIIHHEGFSALFKGTVPSLLKAGPTAAIVFGVYEALMSFMEKLSVFQGRQRTPLVQTEFQDHLNHIHNPHHTHLHTHSSRVIRNIEAAGQDHQHGE